VMGPAGKEFVYKDELKAMRLEAKNKAARGDTEAQNWLKEQETLLSQRYEAELMNPKEALSLGSISQIVMPQDLRQTLGENFIRYIEAYQPRPMTTTQREFH
jgi:acetyl-CoA carboxylase carboxyltransferase component